MTLHLVVMGVSGCGKSTFGRILAEDLGADFLDADDLHPPENRARMAQGLPLDDAMRAPWLDACATSLGSAPRAVLACSALRRGYRDRLRHQVPDLVVIHLDAPQADIARRLAARQGHFMPASLLPSQFATLEPPAKDEAALVLDARLPSADQLAMARAAIPALVSAARSDRWSRPAR